MPQDKDKDVTHLVGRGDVDGEHSYLTKCVCGDESDQWDFVMSIYPDDPAKCPKCGRKFYFSCSVTVFEVVDDR